MVFKDILRNRAKKSNSVTALKKLHPTQIIGKPLITEKAYKQVELLRTYAFLVHDTATKNDIKQALFFLYNVTPTSVRVVHVPYKGRTQRKLVRRAAKKAVVTLKEGDKIELTS